MSKLNAALLALLALALVGQASPSAADPSQVVDIATVSAGLAIPFKTDDTDGIFTEAVITNLADQDRTLHFDLLNGDENENWEVQSWHCTLTARETMFIGITNDAAGGSNIVFECDGVEGQRGAPYAGNDGQISSTAEQGVIWVTVQNSTGQTVGDNVLFGDFTVGTASSGIFVTAPAAGFAGGSNDGDRNYQFDGNEYARFPAALATNYLPPADYPGQLLVFTLDGIPGLSPKVRARVLWYNDDEDYEDASFTFKCGGLLDYAEIAPGLDALETSGHMEIIPVFEPSESQKKVPFLCYNIQDGPIGANNQMDATMRPCAQSTSTFSRTPEPSLDTQL